MFVALLSLLIKGILQHVSTTGNQKSKRYRGGEDRAIIVAINSNCPHFLLKSLCSWACLREVFESNLNDFILFTRQYIVTVG
jgi:hypothetical protein